MATDVSASTVRAGNKTYYSFDVIDEKGQVLDSYNTTDPIKAQEYVDAQKLAAGPEDTINGNPIGDPKNDPFKNGDFKSQSDDPDILDELAISSGDHPELEKLGLKSGPDAKIASGGAGRYEQMKNITASTTSTDAPVAKTNKKARDTCGMSAKRKEAIESLGGELNSSAFGGVFGSMRTQSMVDRYMTESERSLGDLLKEKRDNNAFIILGNDRVGNPETGYGGYGHTQCDAIDIVAGMGGACPKEVEAREAGSETQERSVITNPNFFVDAARIYISQKTDVDKNFGIGKFGKSKPNKNRRRAEGRAWGSNEDKEEREIGKYGAKSAIAMKADNIRVIGRESLRLVTGTDEYNSQGGRILGKHGIEIIAMNKVENLQPMVLGNNLELALTIIVENLEALCEIFEAYVHYQMKMNQATMKHTHHSPFFALKDLPSAEVVLGGVQCDVDTMMNTELSVLKHITNLQGVKANFLVNSGDSYINSENNKVN